MQPAPAKSRELKSIPLKEINETGSEDLGIEQNGLAHDIDQSLASFNDTPMPMPTISFDGISNIDNANYYELFFIPPDPTGDVGPHHYVQAVNALIRVYDKTGAALTPPFKLSSLTAPLGTPCASRNDGDPTVVYDPLADRWIISEFCMAFPPFRQMIAVSKNGDPAGQYFVYEFVMPNVRINDYPKLAVWPDGYYMSTDEFLGSDYVGSGAFAFDRQKMLAGDPAASYVYFHREQPPPDRIGGILPSDLDGLNPPPAGTPNTFVGYTATEYGDAADGIRLFDFHVDFAKPSNSTFRERPESPITVPPFDPTSPAGRNDIGQPPPGEKLDSISDRLMYRIAYRNFGDSESLVFNQTVRTTPVGDTYRAGVRLYELRRSNGSNYSLLHGSTLGDTTASRWSGSAALDNAGNVAVSYSFSSDEKRPSILYSGRAANDPDGTFRTERSIVAGTGVQKAFGFRWGDYSTLSLDPEDECTFWVTNEYFTQESEDLSDFAWLTRIGAFKFDECVSAAKATARGVITNSLSGSPIEGATVRASAYSRRSDEGGSYGDFEVVPGIYTLTASAPGYHSRSATITLASGDAHVQNFALEPVPVIEPVSASVSAESCRTDHAVEPGETASIDLSLKNLGSVDATDLVAGLTRTNAFADIGEAQHYGRLVAGGDAVTRSFTFTLSPNLSCGADVRLTFKLFTNGQPLGTLNVPMNAGEVRYALKERFDSGSRTRLPDGWSSAATGAQRPWSRSISRKISPQYSLFTPDPSQVGVNQVMSPMIPIASTIARLTFRNWYEFETTFLRNRLYDGSVLEISIDGNDFQDIVAAGGAFEAGGYDGMIDSCCQNPLAGHMAWSGRSGPNQTSEFITSIVRLPASAAGHTVQFRWRAGTDIGTFREGQYIDDVEVTDGYSCSCRAP